MVGIPGMNVLSSSPPPQRDLRFLFRSARSSSLPLRVPDPPALPSFSEDEAGRLNPTKPLGMYWPGGGPDLEGTADIGGGGIISCGGGTDATGGWEAFIPRYRMKKN